MAAGVSRSFDLDTPVGLELVNVEASQVVYRGRPALRLVEQGEPGPDDATIAILPGLDFTDGVIEALVAGAPRQDAPSDMRGFVGIAFRVQRVQPGGARFECFFIRPTNGRADDQLRRNHSTQYIAHPDWPWHRLRDEAPGVYESYTDLVAGAWTPLRIEVSGARARLTVNGAEQPCLVVNDLKLGETGGRIALWIGGGTEAHFSTLTVR